MSKKSGSAQRPSAPQGNEVLPHLYGTPEKDTLDRATEGAHGEAHAGSGRDPSTAQPRRLGRPGLDGEQLGDDPGVDPAGREATDGVGNSRVVPPDRGGDCPRPGLGQQEAVTTRAYSPSLIPAFPLHLWQS